MTITVSDTDNNEAIDMGAFFSDLSHTSATVWLLQALHQASSLTMKMFRTRTSTPGQRLTSMTTMTTGAVHSCSEGRYYAEAP